MTVTDITANSRSAVPGGLFVAYAGERHHGIDFIDEALRANVSAVAWEPVPGLTPPELPPSVAGIRVPNLHDRVGAIADRFFASPSAELIVSGVTGTNGKTTTAYLVANALNALGRTGAYMGTLGFGIGDELTPSALTTPGCISVHRRLRAMADAGATDAVIEVSSHGLDQGRIDGVRVRVAAFTNLSRDHLDYHATMAAYQDAKAKLFLDTGTECAVINISDPFGAELVGRLPSTIDTIAVQVGGAKHGDVPASLCASRLRTDRDGTQIALSGRFGEATLQTPMWGSFNVENVAVAAGMLLAQGFDLDAVAVALTESRLPPGRMQLISAGKGRPLVVVDFAHTPDALEKALSSVREHCRATLWCVFGCGGERDQGKRGPMGATAAKSADRTIVTDDNPRDEDPDAIIADIIAGAGAQSGLEVIRDREVAITTAISSAGPDDVVLIAGKGSERVQIAAGRTQDFSDAAVARAALGLTE